MSRIGIALILTLTAPMPVAAEDAILATYKQMTEADPDCRRAPQGDEILVCGRRDADRYRLPLKELEAATPRAGAIRGEVPRATTQLVVIGPCGIHPGQRRCNKFESRGSGMGGGNDPITLLMKLGKAIVDPDADPGPPMEIPAIRR